MSEEKICSCCSGSGVDLEWGSAEKCKECNGTGTLQKTNLTKNPMTTKSATFSPCRLYRYSLWRRWDLSLTNCVFIGLNPSTADETLDDPTIRRCINFAKEWGHGSLCMLNIFAYRATQPKKMKAAIDPVGPENDMTLKTLTSEAGIVIAAWGVHGVYRRRGRAVAKMIPNLYCLGITKEGHPKHPLYLRKDSRPIAFTT